MMKEKGKQDMVDDLDSFNVANINSYRTDSIERYQKGQATELRIKQLETEADSLKVLKNQPH
jgi:hypothetical protein